MRTFLLFVCLSFTCLASHAETTNQVFTGNWSEAIGGLKLRFIVTAKEDRPGFRQAIVFLEMNNVANCINPIEFPSSFSLKCTLTNSTGQPPSRPALTLGSGFICPSYWIYIPWGSMLKMRVDDMNSWAVGLKNQTGVSMAVGSGCWFVPDNDTNNYFLTGVFKVD